MKFFNKFFSRRFWFGTLMVLSTLSLAATAAYYSVFGLSSLFAGAKTEVIIMASALEIAKLIVASYLHNNWKKIGGLLRVYLTMGVGILMIITSAGIYGFLTSAYQTTADQLTVVEKQTEVIDMKRTRFTEQLDGYRVERTQLNQSISELTKGLSNNVIQYKDSETGEIITTTSSSTRRVLTEQLNDMKSQRTIVSERMEVLTDTITKLDLRILDLESNNEVAAEIGPLRYMAEITGKPMSIIVNWFTLLIVFVFDPLAIAMVIAVNKFIGKEESQVNETEYLTSSKKNKERLDKAINEVKEWESQIKKNEEILATKKTHQEDKVTKEEFMKQLDDVEEGIKQKEDNLYRGFRKPYTGGVGSTKEWGPDSEKK